jgi:hypothetical protein
MHEMAVEARMFQISTFAWMTLLSSLSFGQEAPRTQDRSTTNAPVPVYRVTVVAHGIDAVNYQYGSLPTKIDFQGTVLLPNAKGEATVQSKRARTEIDAKFENLVAPTRFGREYLTYVLWAISPEGAPHNLGEVLPNASDHAKLRVTTDLQAFAMMVTAEPYSTVQQPSQVVTLENKVRPDTVGKIQPIQPNPALMRRGDYTWQIQEQAEPVSNAPKVSMGRYEALVELYQAQSAVAVAQAAGAETSASDALAAARRALSEAQRLEATKADSKLVIQNAREAAQSAEDARVIADRRKQEDQLAKAEADARQARAEAEAARSGGVAAPSPNGANREASEPDWRSELIQRLNGSFAAQDTSRGLLIIVPDSAFDGVNLLTAISPRFAPIAAAMASRSDFHAKVQSYTDRPGGEFQAMERSQAVRNALVTQGAAPGQVSIEALGSPSTSRVELVLSER